MLCSQDCSPDPRSQAHERRSTSKCVKTDSLTNSLMSCQPASHSFSTNSCSLSSAKRATSDSPAPHLIAPTERLRCSPPFRQLLPLGASARPVIASPESPLGHPQLDQTLGQVLTACFTSFLSQCWVYFFFNLWLTDFYSGFPGGTSGKKPPAKAGTTGAAGSIPGSGGSPRGGNGSPLQCDCLRNPTDRGAWQATVHGVAESDTSEEAEHTPEPVKVGSARCTPRLHQRSSRPHQFIQTLSVFLINKEAKYLFPCL